MTEDILVELFNKCSIHNIKGKNCSIKGKEYEIEIYNIVNKCKLYDKYFNTQLIHELGGCTHKNDIQCNLLNTNDIGIEIKKYNSPDWMQCSLKYNEVDNKWVGSLKNVIPDSCKLIFEDIISEHNLFNGKIPPFITKDITHEEWIKIKKETKDFNDIYIDCPNDTIQKLYREKKCNYIQISKKGLYHLGEDICHFNVPEFKCEQQLRIRTKIHTKYNNKGFCKLSVTVACQPKNIKKIENSKFSLDDILKLPLNLIHDSILK